MLISNSQDAKIRKFTQMVAEKTGQEYGYFRSPQRMLEALAEDASAIIFSDPPAQDDIVEFETSFLNVLAPGRIFYLSEKRIDHYGFLVQNPLFGCHLSVNEAQLWNTANAEVIARVIRQILGRSEGLEPFLNRDGKILEIPLTSTLEKNAVVGSVREHLMSHGFSGTFSEKIAVAADELLMNAMYDAPVDELGTPLMTKVARNSAQPLIGKNRICFQFGYDSERCAVQAVDYFGSMDKATVLSHVSKVYKPDEYQVSQRTVGAGLGLATIYRSGASLFFQCKNRSLTVATAILNLNGGSSKLRNQFQFVATQFE